jgi:hypothetical protein
MLCAATAHSFNLTHLETMKRECVLESVPIVRKCLIWAGLVSEKQGYESHALTS